MRNAGAIGELPLETTSSLPRYYLASDFAALFDPGLEEQALEEAIERWRAAHIDERARRAGCTSSAGPPRLPRAG